MTILIPVAEASASPLLRDPSSAIHAAANLLLPKLEQGQRVETSHLRRAM